jgi:hypothetical protein
MKLPQKTEIPMSQEWAIDFVYGLMEHTINKSSKRKHSYGQLHMLETDTEAPTGKVPLGRYYREREDRKTLDKEAYKNPVCNGNVNIYVVPIGDYVRQLYPVKGQARTEYATGLLSYCIAHELGHKFHLENVRTDEEPPVSKLLAVAVEQRMNLVNKSIPRFIYYTDHEAIEGTPLGERLTLRQSYLAGNASVLERAFPSYSRNEVKLMCGREFTAHLAGMTTLGEYIEKEKIPEEAGNIKQEIVQSLINMNKIIQELPSEERISLYEGLRWLETDGRTTIGTPLLGDENRLKAMLHSRDQRATEIDFT